MSLSCTDVSSTHCLRVDRQQFADPFLEFPISAYRALTENLAFAVKRLSKESKYLILLVPVAGLEPAAY